MVSDPHNICFFTSFGIFAEKKIGMFFFSKNFAKIKNPFFFENFFKNLSNFSKTTQYFFLIIFGPLRRHIKTSLKKKLKKKSNFIFVKKFRNFFFFEEKFWPKKFTKDFFYKIFIKGFPL